MSWMGPGQTYVTPLLPQPVFQHPATLGLANLLMIQSWGFGPSIGGTPWSLSAEWAAYLIFPLLVMLALFSRSRTALGIAALTVVAFVAIALLTGTDGQIHSGPLDAYDGATCEPLLRCLGGFLLGMLAFRVAQSPRMPGWLCGDAATGAIAVLLVAGLAADLHDLLILPLFPLLLLGFFRNQGCVGRLVGCRPVHWLGVVSYSIYLVHPYLVLPKRDLESLAQIWLPASGADFGASVASYAAMLLASWATFYFVEEPGRRTINRLTDVGSFCRKTIGAPALRQPMTADRAGGE
jgi:peptidoglycan/LPS O-acetylase OafA/YrhL